MNILLYTLFLRSYYLGIRILSIWSDKAKLWSTGRKKFPTINFSKHKSGVVWMHCASLGEFEQGRPLIEAIKFNYPACKVAISFFSPSGYEIMKNYKDADAVFYLPKDSRSNAKKLIGQINPSLVLWIKYEYWFYFLTELKKKAAPTLLIAGVYRSSMPFFKWYGYLWKQMLGAFTHFFVQNQQSKIVLEQIVPPGEITNAGDTRFDRVMGVAEKFQEIPGIQDFCAGCQVIVAGSTWEEDEAEWVHYIKIHPEIKFIIAPHEIDKQNLATVKKQFAGSVFYSEWIISHPQPDSYWVATLNPQPETRNSPPTPLNPQLPPNCLIIDNIGMLSRLYQYATVCYVGGGFRSKGLHNILEAAVYGKPVIFGPEFGKNFEAMEMLECGGAISINSAVELEKILNHLLNDEQELKVKGEAAKKYVYSSAGATQKIVQFIKKNAFLPIDQTVSQKDQHPSSQS